MASDYNRGASRHYEGMVFVRSVHVITVIHLRFEPHSGVGPLDRLAGAAGYNHRHHAGIESPDRPARNGAIIR